MTTPTGRVVAIAAVLAAVAVAVSAQVEIDPFYQDLYREGQLAYERGEPVIAAERIRLACFGFLEDPTLLTEGLAWLAVAQVSAGDESAFRDTFGRIADLDERFRTFSSLSLPDGLETELEKEIRRLIPSEFLAATATFRQLAERPAEPETDLESLPAKRRYQALTERVAAEPDEFEWHLKLAEVSFELDRFSEALAEAEVTLELDPRNQDALCVRGRALGALDRCAEAVADLESCRKSYSDPAHAEELLRCYVATDRLDRAARHLGGLPEEVQQVKGIRRLARRFELQQQTAPVSPADPPPATTATAPRSTDTRLATDGELDRARRSMETAATLKELDEALELGRLLAEAHPQDRRAQHLVAEMAYRASRWSEAVDFFMRGGAPTDDEPELQFYLAVSYYESGKPEQAAVVLRRCLQALQRSQYVETYVGKILGPGA